MDGKLFMQVANKYKDRSHNQMPRQNKSLVKQEKNGADLMESINPNDPRYLNPKQEGDK